MSAILSKKGMLDWVNSFFQLSYAKIEDVSSGALHCQILDCLFPGKVPLHKVNFNAKFEHEFVNNFKILQVVFTNEKINKPVDVPKLVKAKFQDNFEFLQWMKALFDQKYSGEGYDAAERRQEAMKNYGKTHKHTGKEAESKVTSAAASLSQSSVSSAIHPLSVSSSSNSSNNSSSSSSSSHFISSTSASSSLSTVSTSASALDVDIAVPSIRSAAPNTSAFQAVHTKASIAASTAKSHSTLTQSSSLLAANAHAHAQTRIQAAAVTKTSKTELEEVSELVVKARIKVQALEKERNFYFGKLREMEVTCQGITEGGVNMEVKAKLLDVLYRTDDNEAPESLKGSQSVVNAEDSQNSVGVVEGAAAEENGGDHAHADARSHAHKSGEGGAQRMSWEDESTIAGGLEPQVHERSMSTSSDLFDIDK